jgi:hypothetical protein
MDEKVYPLPHTISETQITYKGMEVIEVVFRYFKLGVDYGYAMTRCPPELTVVDGKVNYWVYRVWQTEGDPVVPDGVKGSVRKEFDRHWGLE